MQSINTAVLFPIGKKQFLTNEELGEAVLKYCTKKRESAEKLATTYGWPIGKWDVFLITDFSYVFQHRHHFNEVIRE